MARIPTRPHGFAGGTEADSQPDTTSTAAPALTEEQVRAGADILGLDYDNLTSDERALASNFMAGSAASIDIEDETLDPDDATLDATLDTTTLPDGATTGDADGAGVGPVPDASEGVGAPGEPAAPAPAPAPASLDLTPEEIAWISLQRRGVAQMVFTDPATGQPVQQVAPQVAPTSAESPPEPYIDERAGSEIARLTAELQALRETTRGVADVAITNQQRSIEQAMALGFTQFRETHQDLTDDDFTRLTAILNDAYVLPAYAQRFPGDPRAAITAALDATYWSTPEFREREIQRSIATHQASSAEAERKKAAGSAITSSPGSAPRTPPPATTRSERDRGMVGMIEAALQNGQQ